MSQGKEKIPFEPWHFEYRGGNKTWFEKAMAWFINVRLQWMLGPRR